MTGLVLLSGPAAEPISVAELSAHLRLDDAAEAGLLGGLIATARQACEQFLNRALIAQTWRLTLDRWPASAVRFARAPLRSVEAIVVYDADDTATALATGDFLVNTAAEPGLMVPRSGAWPPAPGRSRGGIEIDFTAGFGDGWNDVPAAIRHAVLIMAAHLYERRDGGAAAAMPDQVAGMLRPFRMLAL